MVASIVAGDTFYGSANDTVSRLAKGTDGEVLTLASGIPSWGTGGSTLVTKTADETVNNSTTLQDDDHLVFAMAANTSYIIEAVFLLNATGTTPDFKFGWTVPAGCAMFWGLLTGTRWTGASVLLDETATRTSSGVNGTTGAAYRAFVRNGANAGNLQLQWAQNVADASDSKVLKHSNLIIHSLGAT